MAILNVVIKSGTIYPVASTPQPTMEVTPFSGDLHKIYLISGNTFGSNLIINGGGDGTTDWYPYSGLADMWSTKITGSVSVVTGHGFTGNAQRLDFSSFTTASYGIFQDKFNEGLYKLRFKYRSNTTIDVFDYYSPVTLKTYPANTGSAIQAADLIAYVTPSGSWAPCFGHTNAIFSAGDWFEIDEVNLYLAI